MAIRKKKKPASARSRKRASKAESLGSGLKPKDRAAHSAPQVAPAARHKRVYQASRLKRTRRTKLQVEHQQIIDALERDHPQSVRHVFYLMTNPRLPESVPKDTGYDVVQIRCVKLRRAGRLPYDYMSAFGTPNCWLNSLGLTILATSAPGYEKGQKIPAGKT